MKQPLWYVVGLLSVWPATALASTNEGVIVYVIAVGLIAFVLGIVAAAQFSNSGHKLSIIAMVLTFTLFGLVVTNDSYTGDLVGKVFRMAIFLVLTGTVPFVLGFVLAKVVSYLSDRPKSNSSDT